MARPGITYQEVAAAADSLVAEGDNPTIQRIRSLLGTGSPNTIHKHLTTWRDAAPVQVRKAPELPAELQAAIVRELERQSAEARAELEKALIQSQAEAAELAETGEQLENDMEVLSERNQALSDECQRLDALASERAQEVGKLENELARERDAAEAARIQLARVLNQVEGQDERISALNAELKAMDTELRQTRAARISAEQAAAVSEAKLESTRERLTEAQATGKKLAQSLDKAQAEAAASRKERQTALEAKATEVANARAEAAELRGQLQARTPTTPRKKAEPDKVPTKRG